MADSFILPILPRFSALRQNRAKKKAPGELFRREAFHPKGTSRPLCRGGVVHYRAKGSVPTKSGDASRGGVTHLRKRPLIRPELLFVLFLRLFLDQFEKSADLLLIDRLTHIETLHLIFITLLAHLDFNLHIARVLVCQPQNIE